MKDLRSPLAKARDDWYKTAEYKRLANHSRKPGEEMHYVCNRLTAAFLAGAAAQEKIDKDASAGGNESPDRIAKNIIESRGEHFAALLQCALDEAL